MQYILMMASDNKISSGAFQSMSKLCQLIKQDGRYEPIVVLRNEGDGQQLLDKYDIRHCMVRSHSWIVPIGYPWTFKNRSLRLLKKLDNALAVAKLRKIIRKEHITLVHMNTSYTYVGAIAAQKAGVPYIWHLRELLDLDQNRTFWDDSYQELYTKASRLIAISQFVFNHFAKKILSDNMVMIPNGIDIYKYYMPDKEAFATDCTQILCIGNMNGTKGQEILIRACGLLKEQGFTDWHVNFVGGGTQEHYYKEFCAQLELNDFMTFCGIQKDTISYYRQTDVMIMSSKTEAFGRTTIEAMLAGCVIIGSNSGATPELLGQGTYGYLYDGSSAEELCRQLYYVLTHKQEAAGVAHNGQKMAQNTYTAQRNAEHILAIYDSVREA